MDVTLHPESLTLSAVDMWNRSIQLSSHWKMPRTKRAAMEDYSGRDDTATREVTEAVEMEEAV